MSFRRPGGLVVFFVAVAAIAAIPAFEIASVKPAVPGTTGGRIQYLPGGKFRASNVPLTFLIQFLYGLKPYQVVGEPAAMATIADGYSARYEIQASAADELAKEDDVREMAKALLAERFQLKFHMEMRDLPVYALVPAKSGIRLAALPGQRETGIESVERGWMQGDVVSMPAVIQLLGRVLDRPLIDHTGFTDPFGFRLTFNAGSDAAA